MWTKESITTKPFNQTIGEEWTDEPINFTLSDIFTELRYQMKYRKTSEREYRDLPDIFTLFRNDKMKRLLIEGIYMMYDIDNSSQNTPLSYDCLCPAKPCVVVALCEIRS